MADNVTLNAGSGGAKLAAKEITHSGDVSQLQAVSLMGVAGTDDAYTAVDILAGGGVQASALRVTLANDSTGIVSLTTSTASIGKLAANTGVDIGDVDVTSVVPGTAATNLGKAEDAAHTSGDVGIMALSVRQDTAAALSGTDADYQPLITDASGRLHVNVGNTVTVGSHAVTNAGTFAVQVDGTALTRLTDIETNTDSQAVVGNGAAATAQRVTLANDSTGIVSLTTSTASIGKLAANSGVDIGDVDVLSIAAGDNNIGNVDIVTVPAPLSTTGGGTEATALRVTIATDSTGVVSVDDNGGALTVDGTITANAGTNLNTSALALETGGNLATAVASLSVLDDWDDGTSPGRCRVLQAQDVALDGSTVETVKRFHVVTATTGGVVVITAVASRKFRIRSLSVFSTSTTVTNVWFEDGDGADVFGDSTGIPVDADGQSGSAGFVLGYNPDGWFQTATVNKNLVVQLTAAQKVVIVGTYIEVA